VQRAAASACEQFETVFLCQILESAGFGRMERAAGSSDDASEDSTQRSVFSSFVSTALAQSLVASGGSGLARELERLLGDELSA